MLSGYAIQIIRQGKPILYTRIYGTDLKEDKPFGFTPWAYTRPISRDGDHVSLIKLAVSFDGDKWRIKVSVVKGSFRDKGEQDVATYTTSSSQTVKVSEMAEFGVEPFEVEIVPIKPETARPPQITNQTHSIAVLNISGVVAPAPYQLLLQNLSHKAAIALEVNTYNDGQRTSLYWPIGTWDRPLIDPQGTYEMKVKSTTGKRLTSADPPPSQPDRIEIATVVFEDGTYEGDPLLAAQVNARLAAARAQLRRVISLLRDTLGASDEPSNDVISTLSKAAASLRDYPEPGEIDEVSARFPMLNDRGRAGLTTGATEGLHAVKSTLRFDIAQFQDAKMVDSRLLRDWLNKMLQKYESWLSSL